MSHRERLLKYYDFTENPPNLVPIPSPTGTPAPPLFVLPINVETPIANLTLDRINPSDRVELGSTVIWNISTSATVTLSAAGVTLAVPLTISLSPLEQLTFRVWRDAIGGQNGTLVGQATDFRTGGLSASLAAGTAPGASVTAAQVSTATTTFITTDTNVPVIPASSSSSHSNIHEHTYFLTATAAAPIILSNLLSALTVGANTISISVLGITVGITITIAVTPSVQAVYFGGSVIDENDT